LHGTEWTGTEVVTWYRTRPFWYRNGLVPNASGTERDLTPDSYALLFLGPLFACAEAGDIVDNKQRSDGAGAMAAEVLD